MSLWSLSGCYLNFVLPAAILEPVLSFVDRYMVFVLAEGNEVIEVQPPSVQKTGSDIELSYPLPTDIFDCGPRTLVVNCLLVEDGTATFHLMARDKAGEAMRPYAESGAIHGGLDYFDGERVRGWAADDSLPDTPVHIGIFVDNQLAQRVTAADLRRDIQRKRGGNGLYGFQTTLPAYLFDGKARALCCAPLTTLRPLKDGLIKVDRESIETTVMALIRNRIERLEALLD